MTSEVINMARIIKDCPSCGGKMKITTLRCPDCGLEIKNEFEPENFSSLTDEQAAFLRSFLKNRGMFKAVQSELGISYPAANKKFDELLRALGMEQNSENKKDEVIDVNNWVTNENSRIASDIIKTKLKNCGGRVLINTVTGLPVEIKAAPDGVSFLSDKLPINPPYRYEVFDVIVELLLAEGGRARKGNGRNNKLGDPDCDETTVVGYVASRYMGKKRGESVYDPVFVLAAVLDWAGIAENLRGEIALTPAYKNSL